MTSLYRRSLQIPDDFALLGCNNIEEGAYAEPPLSTFQFPYAYLAEMMIGEAMLKTGMRPHKKLSLPLPEPMIRETCGGRQRLGNKLQDTIRELIQQTCTEIQPESENRLQKKILVEA